jgi:beta-lactamase class A
VRSTKIWIPALAALIIIGGGFMIRLGLRGGSTSASAGSRATASPTGPSPEELAKALRAKQVQQLNAALTAYATTAPDFSVAVLDRKTGQRYSFQGTAKFDTASVVKASVLACLLLRAQDKDRDLTASEKSLTGHMIRESDNNATTTLFGQLGKVNGLTKCDKRLGMTQTLVSPSWGLTRTTADDQVRLLSEMVDAKGPLEKESQTYAYGLMSTVLDADRWGVPSIAKPGETATVKNGWDTRSADGGLWAINTIGRIVSADKKTDVSLAVLSHKNQTKEAGIALVEKVAAMTRQYLQY